MDHSKIIDTFDTYQLASMPDERVVGSSRSQTTMKNDDGRTDSVAEEEDWKLDRGRGRCKWSGRQHVVHTFGFYVVGVSRCVCGSGSRIVYGYRVTTQDCLHDIFKI